MYTGYRLCKNVLEGVEGGSWGFFAAGVGFIVVGAVMLFIGGRNYLRREKGKTCRAGSTGTDHQENTAGRRKENHEYCRPCKTCGRSG